jgi:hypothetical protein
MTYNEEHRDLFSVDFKKYTPAHCISSDCRMGAGIAVPMRKKFGLSRLVDFSDAVLKHPTCIFHNDVYNLITKEKYWHKPTYQSIEAALLVMKRHALDFDKKFIAMPKIGSGLDGLSWPRVREIVKEIFKDTDIEILVCFV